MTFPFPQPTPMEPTLSNVIRSQGLTGNLRLLMDAHDNRSYAGSGQTWFDLSGNGYDFFFGTNSSATAEDPAFAGTPGRPDAYFAFDGGDYFRYDSANEAWMNAIHKDNAKYTFIAYLFPKVLLGLNHPVIGNNGGAAGVGVGFHFGLQNNDKAFMRCANGVGSGALLATSTNGTNDSAWNFIAASVDEATGFGAFQVNAAQETFSSTYNTPSAAAASQTTEIGARGAGSAPLPSGVRLGGLAVWEGVALTQAQINAIFLATRGPYGL